MWADRRLSWLRLTAAPPSPAVQTGEPAASGGGRGRTEPEGPAPSRVGPSPGPRGRRAPGRRRGRQPKPPLRGPRGSAVPVYLLPHRGPSCYIYIPSQGFRDPGGVVTDYLCFPLRPRPSPRRCGDAAARIPLAASLQRPAVRGTRDTLQTAPQNPPLPPEPTTKFTAESHPKRRCLAARGRY